MLLDIVFRFGEHHYQNEDSIWMSLFLAFIGAFFGYLFALRADRYSRKKTEKEEKHQIRLNKFNQLQYFKDSIDAVVNYIPKQNKLFKEFSEKLKANPLEIIIPDIGATYDLLRLKEVDNIENREAFFEYLGRKKDNIKVYQKAIAHADFLNRIYQSREKDITRANGFKHKDQLFIRDCLDEISMNLGLRLSFLMQENKTDTEEFKFFSSLVEKYEKLVEKFIVFEEVKNEFINPVFYNSLQIIEDKEIAREVFAVTKKAHSRLRNIEENSKNFAKEFENFDSNTDQALNELTDLRNMITKINLPNKE